MQAGRLVQYARRRAGLTQRALAERAGVHQPAIARIERGVISPRSSMMLDLLAAAGYTVELVPRMGAGVDRSLIRAARERAPEDRIRAATVAARNLASYLDAVHEPDR